MNAAIYRRYGPPDVVQIANVPTPDVKATEILVKVRATTVTAGDSRLRSGRVPRGFAILLRLGFGIRGPRKPILGWELAGEVVAAGQSVTRFAPGDTVFAARMGCHAEYVAVPESSAAPLPRNLTFQEAAALTFGGLTSLFYLRDKGRVQQSERVLINGASGAVGTAAVQLAKHFGAVVTGVCSAAHAPIEDDGFAAREIQWSDVEQQPSSPDADERPHHAPGHAKQRAFEQAGAQNGGAARAKCSRDRELSFAFRGSGEQHRGEVHGEHQQQERARGSKREERGPDFLDQIRLQANRVESQATLAIDRKTLHPRLPNALDCLLNLLRRGATTRTNHRQRTEVLRVYLGDVLWSRFVDVGYLRRPACCR